MSNKKFNARHGVSVGTTPVDVIDDTGAVLTNAATATKLLNSRTISISGDIVATGSFDGSGNLDLAATIQANSVALGTDTTGNYMVDVSAGTGVSVSHTQGEGSTATISIGQAVGTSNDVTFNNLTLTGELRGPATFVIDPSAVGDNTGKVVIKGDLQIDGTTTTINSTTLTVDDLVLTLGGDTAPSSDDTFDKGIEYRWFDTQARVGFFGFDRSTGKLTFIPQSSLSSGVYSGTTGEIDAKLDWSNVLNKPTIDNTTYNHLAVTTTGGALLRLNSSGGANDDVKFASGTNVTVAYTNDDTITISSSYVDTNTTYSVKASAQTNGAGIDLDAGGSGSGTDTVKILGSGGTTVTRTDADTITLSSTSVGDGILSIAAKSAGATNTDVTLELSGAYSANTSTDRTIKAVVGPAITALTTFMNTATAGFIRRTGQDTYGIDTNTYLTGNQSISLTGDTTGSGATSIATTTNYITSSDDRTKAPADDTTNKMRFGFTSWANNGAAPYADYLHLRSYTDATGGSDNLVMFRKDAIGMRIWQQAWGSTSAYSTYKDVAFTDQLPTVNNGALSVAAKSAGATNTDVTLELSGAYSANTSTDRTIKAVVGPALTALTTFMTTSTAGFIKRTGQDTYGIDTNTYLTSYTESDTLATVTGRGASATTAINLRTAQATSTTGFGTRTWDQVPPQLYLQSSTQAIGAGGSIGFGAKDSGTTDYLNWRIRSVFGAQGGGFGANMALLFDAGTDGGGTTALSNVLTLFGNGNASVAGIIKTASNSVTGLANGTWSTAKTVIGGLHFNNGAGVSGNGYQAAITFQGGNADEAQAGIYVHNNSADGTHMAFATTNSYSTGPQIALSINNNGVVNFPRARPTWNGSALALSSEIPTVSYPVTSVSGTAPITVSPTTGAVVVSHGASGVTAGTYNNVTVNATGHVTSGSNASYLTAEADTLGTVTGRGASTSTNITLSGGTTSLGHATLNTLTASTGSLTIKTADSTTVDSRTMFISTGNTSAAGFATGNLTIRTGSSTGLSGGYAGDILIWPGNSDSTPAQTSIRGGASVSGNTTFGQRGDLNLTGGDNTSNVTSGTVTAGYVYILGGTVSNTSTNVTKYTGGVYISGGGSGAGGTISYGSVNIGSLGQGTTYGTSAINIGVSGIVTTINGTVKLPNVGTSGFVKLGAGGQLSADTNTYLTGTKVDSITATTPIVASASTGTVTLSHAASGVTAGTYNNVTVNATGHVTSGSNASYLTAEADTLATVTGRGNTATAGNLGLTAGEGYGFTFWGNGDNYKISMGVSVGTYQYGPVTDYSIKTQMNAGDSGRGFTWGTVGNKPVAALNGTSGNMQIAGSFAAASKSFLIPHPTKEGWKLRYGSLEGPENGVYIRGKLKVKNKIELPEYWTKLVDPDSITVTLTPIGKHQKLYVEDISNNVVTIANDGLFAGEINCFFVVYGERVDIDKLVVEYE